MEYVKLGDICSKIGSGATPTGGKEAYQGGGFKLIRSQNVLDLKFSCDGLAEINGEQAEKLRNVEVFKDDVLLNITGDSVARSCLAPEYILPARVNQHVAIIRPNETILNKYYLLCYLQLNKQYLLALASTGGTRNALTKQMIEKLPVPQTPLPIQRKIASILSAYDNLIENNAKRIKLLEQMAENLYKEWFVRFRFPGHEHVEMVNGLPKGWKVERLSNIAVYSSAKISGSDIDLYISTENMLKESAGIDINMFIEIPGGNVTKVCINDVLVSNIRPYFKKIWLADRECGCSNDVLSIRAKMGIDPIFLYYSIRKDAFFDHMVAGSNGTKMPRGNKNFTMKYQIIVPDDTVMSMFSAIAQRINKQRHVLEQQSQLLTRQRDLLLPRLMSGKLEVKL